jgi:hypothetical protein
MVEKCVCGNNLWHLKDKGNGEFVLSCPMCQNVPMLRVVRMNCKSGLKGGV